MYSYEQNKNTFGLETYIKILSFTHTQIQKLNKTFIRSDNNVITMGIRIEYQAFSLEFFCYLFWV